MMSEAIDETLDKDEAEEETEELTNQVGYSSKIDFFFLFFSFKCVTFKIALSNQYGSFSGA